MAPPRHSYDWTPFKRHVIHLCHTEFGLGWDDVALVYNHIFPGSTFRGNRLRDEWVQRKTKTRSKMWTEQIDKKDEDYTTEEQADRHLARQDISAALQTLMLRLSTTATSSASPPPPSAPYSSNAVQAAPSSVEPADGSETIQAIAPPSSATTLVNTSSPSKRQALPESHEDSPSQKQPRLVRVGHLSRAREAATSLPSYSTVKSSYDPRSSRVTKPLPLASSAPFPSSTDDDDVQHELARKDKVIEQQQQEIARLFEENGEFGQKYREKVRGAADQHKQAVEYYKRAVNSEKLVENMFVPQTPGAANQEYEKGTTLRILQQATFTQTKIDKANKKIKKLKAKLAQKDVQLRLIAKELEAHQRKHTGGD